MRVLDSFVTVLISAGVLSSVNAQGENPWCQILSGQQGPGNEFSQFNPADFQCPTDLERFLRKKCEDNGSESSYDNAKEGLTFSGRCLELVLNEKEIESDVNNAQSSGKVDSVAKKYCPRVPVLNECIRYAIDRSRSCLERFDESESLDVINNMISSFLEFICENDGDRITTFWTNGGLRCLASKREALQNCAANTFAGYIPATSYVGAGASEMGRFANPLILNAQDCNNLDKFRRCAANLLADCGLWDSVNIFNSAFGSIKNASTCENFPEIEESSSTDILLFDNETEIFNSTSAPEYNVYGELDLDSIHLYDNDTEIFTSTSAPEYNVNEEQELKIFIREKCEKNGGPEAWDNLIQMSQSSSNCIEKLQNTIQNDVDMAESQADPSLIFNKVCRKVRSSNKCMKKFKRAAKSCLERKERKTVDVLLNVTNSLLQFACEDDAEKFKVFVVSGGVDCVQSNGEALLDCAKQTFGSSDPNSNSGTAIHSALKRIEDPLIINHEDCINVRKYQQCTVKVLREQCQDSMPATVVDILIDRIVQFTPCSRYIKRFD